MQESKTNIEVRYAETDQMGVVHHATYLVWFEVGRTNFIKDLGFSYAKMEAEGYLAPLTDASISYKRPFRYGETAEIRTSLEYYNGIRSIYRYEIYNDDDELCISGTTTHVLVQKETFKPIRMEKVLPEWHDAYQGALKEG